MTLEIVIQFDPISAILEVAVIVILIRWLKWEKKHEPTLKERQEMAAACQ